MVITGAGGLVGTALRSAFEAESVVILKHRDLDISDAVAVAREIPNLKANLIINCAVAGVDECEHDPELARRVNIDGPRLLAEAAHQSGAALLHFSSNYVFDGDRSPNEPYTIYDAAKPINVYGQTKLEGERAASAACERTFIVRTSWVFGRGKDSFLSTAAARLARGERIRAITDTWASTTYVEELAGRVLEIAHGGHYGTYHVVNEGSCTYELFAQECAEAVGADEGLIERVSEADAKRPARRPRVTPMRCLMSERIGLPPLRHWRVALRAYIATP